MNPDAPEYYTEASTPISPIPLHLSEPSSIPVLQNQIDPVFNMTSTHITASDPTPPSPKVDPAVNDHDGSQDEDLSDIYDEPDTSQDGKDAIDATAVAEETTELDDYAKTFESDAEEISDSQDISRPSAAATSQTEPLSVSAADQSAPIAAENVLNTGTDQVTVDNDPTASTAPAIAEPVPSAISNEDQAPPGKTSVPAAEQNEETSNGGIDIQQLLDNITATVNHDPVDIKSPVTGSSNPLDSTGPLGHASLPPRPPSLPVNNVMPDPTFYPPPPSLGSFAPGSAAPPATLGAPGTESASNGLPPPPTASFQTPVPLPMNPHGQYYPGSTDASWGPAMQKEYDDFLEEERSYVSEGLWDRFPVGSRLFIGNLPTEKVSKREIFRVFHKYGKLAQISLKQAYGFVQFHTTRSCYDALEQEQGTEVAGRRIHLEVSKPQKNTRGSGARRSRSPENLRGSADKGRNGRNDRTGGRGNSRDDGRGFRRDEYRSRRSPSPQRGRGGRDDFGTPRGRHFDGRDRRRSRSRSPYGRRDRDRGYRERSLSPRSREAMEDADLQIPRRSPHDVPDVQLILMDELDRGFVTWVDNEFRSRNIKTDIMFLSPRLPIGAVVRRQILEGVHAVIKLTRRSQELSKIPLQVFDRKGGANNVRFDEYQDLEPRIAAELALRAKAESIPSYPPYMPPQQYQPPVNAPVSLPAAANLNNVNINSLLGQLDNATMQKLLAAMSAPQAQTAAAPPVDLSGLLGVLGQQASQQGVYQQPPPAQSQPRQPQPYEANQGGPDLVALMGSVAPTSQHPPTQDVQNIMAQLAKYRQ